MLTEGYIKLYRRLLDWEWFGKSEMVHVFVYLLLAANINDGKFQGVPVKRGQVLTSIRELCAKTGISMRSMRTCLARLANTGEIDTQNDTRGTLITICNFDSYQPKGGKSDTQNDTRPTHDRHTTDTPIGDYRGNRRKEEEKEIERDKSLSKKKVAASREERENFLRIFFFLNFVDPAGEVERFCAHYEASGWCRKGEIRPVVDRVALARMWTAERPGKRFPGPFIEYFRDAYDRIRAAGGPAGIILTDIAEVVSHDMGYYVYVRSRDVYEAIKTSGAVFPGNGRVEYKLIKK